MKQYFNYLRRLRNSPGQFSKQSTVDLRTLYLQLMSLNDSSARINSSKVRSLLLKKFKSPDDYIDQLWLFNAYARFLCFAKRDYTKSVLTLCEAAIESSRIYSYRFLRFKNENRCFPILLALNVARVSVISGKYELALKQFDELMVYLKIGTFNTPNIFPIQIAHVLTYYWPQIKKSLTRTHLSYFHSKIRHSKNKIPKSYS